MDFKQEIVKQLKKETRLKDITLEVPPNPEFGDYAFPCFVLAKKLKKSPNEIAQGIVRRIRLNHIIKKIEVKGPYLNFFINKGKLVENTLKEIVKQKGGYGKAKRKKGKIMVEFFHANTHKGVHIGHIRNICLGETLSRIMEFDGFNVIRANYQGDIGPHVAKCLWGYMHLKQKIPKTQRGDWLGKVYTKANKLSAENEKIQDEIKEVNKKLYSGDRKIIALWKKTRNYCLDDFKELYKDFGVKFNRLYFESEVEKRGVEIANELLKKGIAKKSQGALIVDLEKYSLGVYVVLTQDGHAVYHTKDLALAELKTREYQLNKSVHVVGKEQELYFNQLFKTFEIIKSKLADKSMHLIYGLVMLPEGKMSSREGTLVLYSDLIEKILKTAEKEIKNRHKKLGKKELEKRKKQIAFGALKFSMLNRENNKQILFDWKQALKFEGDTGPYIQYSHARICSILRKYKKRIESRVDFSLLKEPQELKLVNVLGEFPELVKESANSYKPHLITYYLLKVAQTFNEFYEKCHILQEKEDLKKARLVLVSCVKQVLQTALGLLGITAPERM